MVARDIARRIRYVLNERIRVPESQEFRIIAERRRKASIDLAVHLPPGVSYKDLERQIDALYAAVGAPVELTDRAGVVVVSVLTQEFPSLIPFEEGMLSTDRNRLLLGYNQRGEEVTHPVSTNPHLLIAGTSGYGKTDLLRFLLLQLIHSHTPEELEIYVIDLKGSSFKPFKFVPHVRHVARKLRDAAELLSRLRAVSEARADRVWNTGTRSEALGLPRIVVLIDEASRIAPVSYRRDKALLSLAQQADTAAADLSCVGRELRMGLWYCTQRPDAKIMNPQVKNNVNAAIAFRVKTASNSEVVIDRSGAERLPEDLPGRAIYATTRDTVIQVPYVGTDERWEEVLRPYVRETNIKEGKEETDDLGDAFDPSRLLDRTGGGVLPGAWKPFKESQRDPKEFGKGAFN